ncbi:MAG: GIY-YIG nuclease family protein [Desulfovibrio sp.]|nr:GIY-YIG nuclease family protein [Desulfovibrio sp.]
MSWQVYLLRCNDGTYYCGITTDISRRLLEHNGKLGRGARYTAARRPVELLAVCSRDSRSAALKLEALVKKAPKNRKMEILASHALP